MNLEVNNSRLTMVTGHHDCHLTVIKIICGLAEIHKNLRFVVLHHIQIMPKICQRYAGGGLYQILISSSGIVAGVASTPCCNSSMQTPKVGLCFKTLKIAT